MCRRYLFPTLFCFTALCLPVASYALTDPAIKNPGLDLYLESSQLVRTPPERFVPHSLSDAPEDISYRKRVLPYAEDRDADMYLVIPQLGLVTPIQHIPQDSTDRNSMINGSEISINKYLKGGIIEYASSSAPWYRGKRIDFGHSNYYASDTGRYRTIFSNLMRLDPDDQVRYYVKQPTGEYELYKYLITESYPSAPSNVDALRRDGNGADALIFGCYNGLKGRRMIEATYIGEPKEVFVNDDQRFAALPVDLKNRIDHAMQLMNRIPMKRRAYQLVLAYKRIESIQWSNRQITDQQTLVLEYILDQITNLYEG